MKNISVHVLIDSKDNQVWRRALLKSLHEQNVEVILAPAINGNMTQARINAFNRQHTEWISWVDPDDLLEPNAYASMMTLASPGVGLVTGDELLISDKNRVIGKGTWFGQAITKSHILKSPTFAHKGIVHRSAIPLAIKIAGDCPFGIDWAMMLAGSIIGDVKKVDQVIYRWRQHPDQTSKHTRIDSLGIAARYKRVKSMFLNNQ